MNIRSTSTRTTNSIIISTSRTSSSRYTSTRSLVHKECKVICTQNMESLIVKTQETHDECALYVNYSFTVKLLVSMYEYSKSILL